MFNSLSKKIMGSMVLVCLFCTIFFTIIALSEIEKTGMWQMENDGRALATSIRREILNSRISDLNKVADIFKEIKEESQGNIIYVSITDGNSKMLVSSGGYELLEGSSTDSSSGASQSETSSADGVSAASASNEAVASASNEAVASASNEAEESVDGVSAASSGYMSESIEGEKVFNVSVPFKSDFIQSAHLNIGISLKTLEGQIYKTTIKILILSLLILLTSVLIGFIIARILTKNIVGVVNNLDKFSKGDFTIEFNSSTKDEIKKLTNALNSSIFVLRNTIYSVKEIIDSLFQMATQLNKSSDKIAVISDQVTSSSQEVASSVSDHSSNISYIVESLDKFSKNLDTILVETNDVLESNIKIKDITNIEYNNLQNLVKVVEDTKQSFNTAIDEIAILDKDISKINEISEVINSIAGQTNLLALNASIESARAGEAGRGFAVVADEIKKLANQVMLYSRSINSLIGNITSNTQKVVNDTQVISGKMDNQMTVIKETVTSCNNIILEVDKIIFEIKEMTVAVKDLSIEKESIVNRVGDISSISTQVAASSEEIASLTQNQSYSMQQLLTMSNNLNGIADKLKQEFSIFKVDK